MIGFFFVDRHSKSFNVMAMENAVRGLLPPLRRNDYEITGRHGTVDFGNETYSTRRITINICFISENGENLQLLARDVAYWLSGKGILYFDDEPERAYDAVVYNEVNTEQLIRAKRASVTFECQPFAKTINYLQSINTSVANGNTILIESKGTQPTPCIIYVKNTGVSNITDIKITRRALIR